MEQVECPRCQSKEVVKNGNILGKVRRKCRGCGYQFTRMTKRGKSQEVINTAIILYLHGLSMNAISKLLGVSDVAVLKWIKKSGQSLAAKPKPRGDEVLVLELDEMWHFLEKKVRSYGFGKPTIDPLIVCLTGSAAIVMGKRSKDFLID